jgi:hypothetical protein
MASWRASLNFVPSGPSEIHATYSGENEAFTAWYYDTAKKHGVWTAFFFPGSGFDITLALLSSGAATSIVPKPGPADIYMGVRDAQRTGTPFDPSVPFRTLPVRYEPDNYRRFADLNELDSGKGKFAPDEAWLAMKLEPYFGTMERAPRDPANPLQVDYKITSGGYAGRKVDFMFTAESVEERAKINAFFEVNWAKTKVSIAKHLAKADFVVLDFQTLTWQNQRTVLEYLESLPGNDPGRIAIVR